MLKGVNSYAGSELIGHLRHVPQKLFMWIYVELHGFMWI
jgi:hypothetical protein